MSAQQYFADMAAHTRLECDLTIARAIKTIHQGGNVYIACVYSFNNCQLFVVAQTFQFIVFFAICLIIYLKMIH